MPSLSSILALPIPKLELLALLNSSSLFSESKSVFRDWGVVCYYKWSAILAYKCALLSKHNYRFTFTRLPSLFEHCILNFWIIGRILLLAVTFLYILFNIQVNGSISNSRKSSLPTFEFEFLHFKLKPQLLYKMNGKVFLSKFYPQKLNFKICLWLYFH